MKILKKNIYPLLLLLAIFAGCTQQPKKPTEFVFENRVSNLDTSFIKKVTIDSICPCQTTLTDLKDKNLVSFDYKELDSSLCPVNADGNAKETAYKIPADSSIVLQTSEDNEMVEKIHLKKGFEGLLPNGVSIKLKDLTVKDVEKLYPTFDYRTTNCSSYWRYTNDTISFYIKIDRSIKKYPLDEKFYADKPIDEIEIALWCFHVYAPSQSGNIVYEKPLFAPLANRHLNCYASVERDDFSSKLAQIIPGAGHTSFNVVKLGRWIEYSPDHKIIADEEYDNKGNLITKHK